MRIPTTRATAPTGVRQLRLRRTDLPHRQPRPGPPPLA
jgi:hypothetical protein